MHIFKKNNNFEQKIGRGKIIQISFLKHFSAQNASFLLSFLAKYSAWHLVLRAGDINSPQMLFSDNFPSKTSGKHFFSARVDVNKCHASKMMCELIDVLLARKTENVYCECLWLLDRTRALYLASISFLYLTNCLPNLNYFVLTCLVRPSLQSPRSPN